VIILFVFNYIIILTMNILNYSNINQIPLGQAGRAASYVLSLIIQYLGFFLLFSNSFNPILKGVLIFLLSFYFSYSSLWTINIILKNRITVSIAIGLTILLFGIVLSIWPIT